MATTQTQTVQFRVTPRRAAVWRAAAAAEDVNLSEFMRRAGDAYARQALALSASAEPAARGVETKER